jgi:hypothetical protein
MTTRAITSLSLSQRQQIAEMRIKEILTQEDQIIEIKESENQKCRGLRMFEVTIIRKGVKMRYGVCTGCERILQLL